MNEEKRSYHDHCENCIKIWKCNFHFKDGPSCEIRNCALECGARFHSCKSEEHKLLCPNEKVSCINRAYGCPSTILRAKTAAHLARCPASVMHCTMEWNRWPLKSSKVPCLSLLHQEEELNREKAKHHLDVALAMRDQRMLNLWFQASEKTKQALRNNLTLKYAAVPFNACIELKRHFEDAGNMTSTGNSPESHRTIPGLQESVCSELRKKDLEMKNSLDCQIQMRETFDDNSSYNDSNKLLPFLLHSTLKEQENSKNQIDALDINLTLELVSKYETKPKSMYTFLCAQDFRRDEYCSHYKNVHSDIHGGLNGWLQQRCPLSIYGCDFSLKRFSPFSQSSIIVHNDILESFGIQQSSNCNTSKDNQILPIESLECSLSNILNLPFEILQDIFRSLDGFSLCNAAMTCNRFREICCSLLEERGIVSIQWEPIRADDNVRWKISHKRWFFSTALTPISQWVFEDNIYMGTHLKNCSFNVPNVHDRPFNYSSSEPNGRIYEKLCQSVSCNHKDGNI